MTSPSSSVPSFWGHKSDGARKAVFWLIGLTFVLRMIGAGGIDLVLGESYYLSSARVLHWSYFDQPPLSLWIIWLTKTLLQTESPLWLRLPFVLMFSLSTWTIYRIGARYRSEWAGFFAALITNISVLFSLSIGAWLQPDAPLMLCWLLTSWVLVDIFFGPKVDRRAETVKWMWAGFWLGLTFLSKYHAVFVLAGTGVFVLTNMKAWRWFAHPGPYIAVIIAAVISSPVVVWNVQNDWVSFGFQGGRALGSGFHLDWLIRMILGQLLYMTPWLALTALVGAILAVARGPKGVFPQNTQPGFAWFLVCLAFIPIILFTANAAWSDSQFHFHWQAPGYMMLFILLGGWIDASWPKFHKFHKVWLSIATVLTTVIVTAVLSHSATGWLRNVVPNGQTMEDPSGEQVEWQELGAVFDDLSLESSDNAFVVALNWQTCGQVDKPLAGRMPLACFSDDPRNIAFNIDLRDMVGRTAYFADRWVTFEGVKTTYAAYFDTFEPIATTQVIRNGFVEIDRVDVVKATGFHLDADVNTGNAPEVTLVRLPRTEIVRLEGELFLPASIDEAQVLLGGLVVATIDVKDHEAQAFEIDVTNDRMTVGISSTDLVVVPSGSVAEGAFGFSKLKVFLN